MISAAAGGNRRRPTSLARAGSFVSMRWVRTIARTAAATRSGSQAISASVVERDLPFYDPAISDQAVAAMNGFARSLGLLPAPVAYEDVVATRFRNLWAG